MIGLLSAAFADDRLVPPPGEAAPLVVMAVAQDDDGWLWFGGVDGLFRYDGERRVRWGGDFLGEPIDLLGFDGDAVTLLAQDRHLYELTPDAWTEVPGPSGAPIPSVSHAAGSDGALWAIVDGALLRRDAARRWAPVPTPFPPRLVRAADVGVWVLGEDEIARVEADGRVRERHPIPRAMDVAAAGAEGWVATRERGVWRWDATGARPIAAYDGEWGESVALAPGGAWVATTRRVLRFEGDRSRHEIPVPQGVPQHDTLLVDREGTLWVGTWAGPRARPTPDAWRLDAPGARDPGLSWIVRAGGVTWGASWSTAGRFDADGRWENSVFTGFSWPFCADASGAPVTRGWRDGRSALVRLGASVVELGAVPNDAAFGGCAPAPGGGLWVGLDDGLHHLGPEGLRAVATPLDGVQGMLADRAGRVHLLGFDRECHADGDAIARGDPTWTCGAPWPGGRPEAAVVLDDGRLWAVGMTTGVLEETPAGWARHPSSGTLGAPTVWSLVPSPRGGVWIVGIGGVVRVAPGPPGAPWTELERLDAAVGVPAGSAAHLIEQPDGALWLATNVGLVIVPADARRTAPPPPPPVVAAVWVDGASVAVDAPVVAPWPRNQVEIRAATATYRDRSRMRWRARIGDAALTESPDPTLRIVDLPAGTYAITLQASADGGATWSAPSLPLRVEVPLPWPLRPPALVAAALLAAAALAGVWRLRLAAALRVERERTRIAMDLHDDLGAGLSTITMLTGLAADRELSDDARREVAQEAATTAATLTDALADIVWTLRRDAGSGGTLARSLVERGRRLFAAGPTRFVVDVAAEWPDHPLSLSLYRNLQLIGYEALQNAARHADAAEVTLRFHPWCLEILDDGRGLSAISPRAGTGTGLPSLQARARAVGAELRIEERPGGGTAVRVTFTPHR